MVLKVALLPCSTARAYLKLKPGMLIHCLLSFTRCRASSYSQLQQLSNKRRPFIAVHSHGASASAAV